MGHDLGFLFLLRVVKLQRNEPLAGALLEILRTDW